MSSARIGLAFLVKELIQVDRIKKRDEEINSIVLKRFSKIQNLILIGPKRKANQIPIFSFLIKFNGKFLHFNYVSALLNDLFGVQSRGGCSCASTYGVYSLKFEQEVLNKLEQFTVSGKEIFRPGYTRVNFSYLYSDQEINYIIDAIEFVASFGWLFLSHYSYKIETGSYFHLKKPDLRVWLNDYKELQLEESNKHNFSISDPIYDKSAFDIERRIYYNVEALQSLREIEQHSKKYFGKSKVNHSVLFEQSDFPQYRWFVIPDDLESYYNLVSSTLSEYDYNVDSKIRQGENLIFADHEVLNISDIKQQYTLEIISCFGKGMRNVEMITEIQSEPVRQDKIDIFEQNESHLKYELELDIEENDQEKVNKKSRDNQLFPKVPKNITSLVGDALINFKMISNGDRILIGLSGGKDSMTLIHTLLYFQKHAPVKFDIGVVTVDPQSDDYKPEPLKTYVKSLGLPYFFESDPILERAKKSMKKENESICAFCSRMKRGLIYGCARREKYNVIALGQHLDDLAESFLMSSFHNGLLRTMKANYVIDAGDLRVIRPFVFCREKLFKEFAISAKLPIIQENCPACFAAPKERHRMKILLSQQENLFPNLFSSLQKAMIPLMKGQIETGKKKDDIDI